VSLLQVSKDFYLPPPAVDGAVISFKLRTRQQQPQLDSQAFFAFVGAAFTSKRKMLRNNLHGLGFDAAAVVAGLGELGLKETTRPNELEWGTYIELFHLLRKKKAAKHADEKMDEAAAVQASE
jgi:16S rRNA A1518/A1519 N6-dimethyltransferase RsmA/KsgA/DIM1 with predicted DNA glycosylase/AP lyase activity